MSSSTSKRFKSKKLSVRTSWDPVARWYSSWVGKRGSIYHRRVAIPTILRLAELRRGENVLDVGCGQGVLAPHVHSAKATYLGIDASRRLLALGRKFHGGRGRFSLGDSRDLLAVEGVSAESFDLAVFMLSIQDMDPLDDVVRSVSKVLKPGGRLVIFMTHPCFRVPRRSDWGYDRTRKLTFRRVDSYLSESGVPMKAYSDVTPNARGATLSFHRPLTAYVNTLARHGLTVDHLDELVDPLAGESGRSRPADIPLFAALRARKREMPR